MANRSLLLVDDDAALADVLARGLGRHGFEVSVAHDRAAAAELVARNLPAFAIVDLRLGENSGLQVISDIRTAAPEDAQIVVLTGYASIATAVDAVKRGASEYLTKPVSLDDLVQVLEGSRSAEPTVPDEPMSVRRLSWEHVNRVLTECEGNISEASRRLGMHRRTLQRMLQKRPPRR